MLALAKCKSQQSLAISSSIYFDLQVDSDYVDQLEHFVPLVCANCEPHPVGLYDPSAEHVRVLNVVCMQALRQHLALAHRVSFSSHHLDHMMTVALDTLAQPLPDVDLADSLQDGMDGLQPLESTVARSSGLILSLLLASSSYAYSDILACRSC